MKNIRNALTAFTVLTVLLLAACAVLTAVVDPFFHYHRPLPGFPYVVDNELSQNPGMAANLEYDSIITGSSMTLNFDTKDFLPMGLNTIKLCTNGALPRDIANVLTAVYDEDSHARKTGPVKAAFIAVDGYTFGAGPKQTKYDQPYWLYDRNPFNDIRYLFSKDVILEYILRPMAEREPTDLTRVYATDWADDFYYRKEWVLQNYRAPERVAEETPADAYIERTRINLETNILPFIESHPETTFYMFFPPYSVLYWNNVLLENHLEATMRQYEFIGETLLQHPNVRVFFFQHEKKIITDLDLYMDLDHYRPEINAFMAACFADGTDEVFPGGMKDALDKTRKVIDSFDYDSLRKETEQYRQ